MGQPGFSIPRSNLHRPRDFTERLLVPLLPLAGVVFLLPWPSQSLYPGALAPTSHLTFPEGFLSDRGFPPLHRWMPVLLFPSQLSLSAFSRLSALLSPACFLAAYLPFFRSLSPVPAAGAKPPTTGCWVPGTFASSHRLVSPFKMVCGYQSQENLPSLWRI